MAAGDTDIGTGTTVTFSGFTMELLSVNWSISRESFDKSHMGTTGGRPKLFGRLYDAGEVTLEVHFKTNEAPPITGAEGALTITFPDAETWACNAGLTAFEFTDPLEDKMTATATFTCSGSITF